MTTHEFEIPARDLDAAGKAFHFPVRAAWLRGAFEDSEATATGPDGELEVRASKSGEDIIVHGTLHANIAVPCARCLAPTPLEVRQPIAAMFVTKRAIGGSKGSDDEYEFSSEEAEVLPFDGETVVLDELVRDELLLEVPMTPLCSEDCPGMSPALSGENSSADASAGEKKALDPRLAPLMRFMQQNEKKKE